jgi:tetratricopeptide (TPR) repeat protein
MKALLLLANLLTLPGFAQQRPGETFEELFKQGVLHFSQEQFPAARSYLEKAVAARPRSFQARFLLGATLVQLNDTAGAIRELRAAHKLDPKHGDALKLLATQHVGSRQFREAIALLRPRVDVAPFDEELHLLLIQAFQSSGDSTSAFELAQKAARRFPASSQVACWLGFQLQFSGRYEDSKKYLRKAIALDPSYPVSYYLLAEVLLQEEKYKEAIGCFRQAIERMPEDAEALMGLSRALLGVNHTAEALQELQKAAQAAPQDARVHLQLSRLYYRLGDETRAQQEADLALRLRDPQSILVEAPAALRARPGR